MFFNYNTLKLLRNTTNNIQLILFKPKRKTKTKTKVF